MPDTKISAFAGVPEMLLADEVPALQGGVNVKVTKQQILTGAVGEVERLTSAAAGQVQLTTDTAQEFIDLADATGILLSSTFGIRICDPTLAYGFFQTAIVNQIVGPPAVAQGCKVGYAGVAQMICDVTTGQVLFVATTAVVIPYFDGSAGAWTIPVPANLNVAIDRLANAVAGLLGGTIP